MEYNLAFTVLQPILFCVLKQIIFLVKVVSLIMHCDVSVPLSYTAIFYCNTLYTEFKDGDKYSVANSGLYFLVIRK